MKRSTFGKQACVLTILSLAPAMSGCVGAQGNTQSTPDSSALTKLNHHLFNPSDLVGGGFDIHYVAPQDGTAYLVQQDSGRIIQTQTIKSGATFEYNFSGTPEEAEKIFGKQLGQVKLLLYFVPRDRMMQLDSFGGSSSTFHSVPDRK